jgi:hypothetical protein
VTFYNIELRQDIGLEDGKCGRWRIARRYRDFTYLRQALRAEFEDEIGSLPFPPKTAIGTDAMVSTREAGLFEWLRSVLVKFENVAESPPELLLFLGMRRSAQRQREQQLKAGLAPRSSKLRKTKGKISVQRAGEVDSTDRLGRSIVELIESQSGMATPEIVSEQLVECATFRAITPKLFFEVRTSIIMYSGVLTTA